MGVFAKRQSELKSHCGAMALELDRPSNMCSYQQHNVIACLLFAIAGAAVVATDGYGATITVFFLATGVASKRGCGQEKT